MATSHLFPPPFYGRNFAHRAFYVVDIYTAERAAHAAANPMPHVSPFRTHSDKLPNVQFFSTIGQSDTRFFPKRRRLKVSAIPLSENPPLLFRKTPLRNAPSPLKLPAAQTKKTRFPTRTFRIFTRSKNAQKLQLSRAANAKNSNAKISDAPGGNRLSENGIFRLKKRQKNDKNSCIRRGVDIL